MIAVVVKFNGSLYPGEVVKVRGKTMDARIWTRVGTPEMRERVVCVRIDDGERSREQQDEIMHTLYHKDAGLLKAAHGWLPEDDTVVSRTVEQMVRDAKGVRLNA